MYFKGIGIYGFVFWRDGEWVYSIIDDKLYLTSPGWDSVSFRRVCLCIQIINCPLAKRATRFADTD
jgi:hypothetical protein